MLRYRLRTLLIVLALGPPILAGGWFLWLFLSEHKLVFAFLTLAAYFVSAIGVPLWWRRRP